jgi:MFS family permease
MLFIFMFLAGIAGSTAVTNVAGTIADLFGDVDGAGQAMALFVISANVGPSVGAPLGAWITNDPNLGLKWIFLLNVIIGYGFACILCFIPETLPRLVIAKGAAKSEIVNDGQAAILGAKIDIWKELRFVTTMTFRILFTEPIIIFLGFYNGFTYGILFLYLDGVFDVFVTNNHLS